MDNGLRRMMIGYFLVGLGLLLLPATPLRDIEQLEKLREPFVWSSLFGGALVGFTFYTVLRQARRCPTEILDRDGRPVWQWVDRGIGWQLGRVVGHRDLGPSVWVGVVPTGMGSIRRWGPRPPQPCVEHRETRRHVEPGWHWVMVRDETWECGYVLGYDAHGGPAGTLLSTPGWHGRVWDAKAWGQPLPQPPEIPGFPEVETRPDQVTETSQLDT